MLAGIPLEKVSVQTLGLGVTAFFLFYYAGWIIYSRYIHPYHDIPGPFLASITTWHRWYNVRYAVRGNLQQKLHRKYGPIVRIAPDEVQISNPEAIDTIYRSDWLKTELYDPFNPNIEGRPEPFAEKNEHIHAQHRRIMAPLFRPEAVSEYDGYCDNIIEIFSSKMNSLVGTEFDLADYVERYTWDTIGEALYSREGGFGMLRDDVDFNGWMAMLKSMPQPCSSLSYVPYGLGNLYFLSQILFSAPTRRGLMSAITAVKQVKALVQQRKEQEAVGESFRSQDMLSKMMEMTRDEKIDFNEADVAIMLNAFVWAGSDTTGSTLAMIMFFIISHRAVYAKLQQELDMALKGRTTISYQEAARLPYLSACVNEGMRLHPILGIGVPRYVPQGGADICGRFFPGGYKVTTNQNVTQRDKGVFGKDADEFRPERWIDNDTETVARMTKYCRPFGYGTRVCLGQHIALTEIYKFVPSILTRHRFQLVAAPTVSSGWIQQPEGLMVKVSQREK